MDLSIIIVTFNTETLVRNSLETVLSDVDEVGCTYEIIVVDNASEDNTVEMVKRDFPTVRLIDNTDNRGCAPARNQGILVSSGEYILILDADTLITSKAAAVMLDLMERNANYGLVGCRLFFPDGHLQPSAGTISSWPQTSRLLPGLLPGWRIFDLDGCQRYSHSVGSGDGAASSALALGRG